LELRIERTTTPDSCCFKYFPSNQKYFLLLSHNVEPNPLLVLEGPLSTTLLHWIINMEDFISELVSFQLELQFFQQNLLQVVRKELSTINKKYLAETVTT
jgi:hypothetical protein